MKRKTTKKRFYKRRNRTNSKKRNNKSLKIKNRKIRNNRRRKVTKKSNIRGGGMMDWFRRRTTTPPTKVTPIASPRPQETIQMGDKKIDWDKLNKLFVDEDDKVLPGQYRDKIGEGRCSRSVPATSRIRSCVERQEMLIENQKRPCEAIEQLCNQDKQYESLPSYMVSSNPESIKVAALNRKTNKVERAPNDHNKVIVYPLNHDVFKDGPRKLSRSIPVHNPGNLRGENGFSTLENEMSAEHVVTID